jgi:hypothetical protein
MRSRRSRRAILAVLLASLAVGATLGLAACGGPLVAATGVETEGCINNQWNYTFRFPTRCILSTPPIKSSDRGLVFQQSVADPTLAVVGGTALDVFSIQIYRMSKMSRAGDLKSRRREFEAMASQIVGKPAKLSMTSGFALDSLGGKPALSLQYRFMTDQQPVVVAAYLVPVGRYAYWISAQSTVRTAAHTTLGVTLSTFEFE